MTLRQPNGHHASNGNGTATTAWPTSSMDASSSTATNVTAIDIRSNDPSSKPSKKHGLLDQKRRQWAEEKAEQEEWYPFGRPGGGAPLKSPMERFYQQRQRRHSSAAPSGSGYSDGGASNGSVTDFSGFNSSLPPVYIQENHCANGRSPQQQPAQIPTPVDSMTSSTSHVYGPNGYFPTYPGMVMTSFPTTAACEISCQTYPHSGAMNNAFPNQPMQGTYHVHHYPATMLPGSVNGVSSSDGVGLLTTIPPYYHQHPHGYGYAQGMGMVSTNLHDNASHGQQVLAAVAPAPVFPASSLANSGRNSLTGSTGNPSPSNGGLPANHAQSENRRQPQSHPQNGASYTEQWADRLQLWQDDESNGQNHRRPTTLAIATTAAPCNDASAVPNSHAQFQSPMVQRQQISTVNTSTPMAYGSHPMAMAWVTPIQAQHQHGSFDQPQKLGIAQQRLAIVSPMHSKAQSLSGNETLDGSASMQLLNTSYTGSIPIGGDDSGIHRRRGNVTGLKGEHELDEKQIKVLQHRMALEEQLAEKRRKQLIEEERERREFERAERERRLIEQRETFENEQERNRWRKMADQEEKREELIMGPLQRAQEEARRVRHAKLLRHASSGRHSESDGYESISPPAATHQNGQCNNDRAATIPTNEITQTEVTPISPTSNGPTASPESRSKSLPPAPACPTESPGDDRPIRPLTKDPLKIWEELGYSALDDEHPKSEPKRNVPVRQSLRKSRSTEATKLETARRAGSLERRPRPLNGAAPPEASRRSVDAQTNSINSSKQNGNVKTNGDNSSITSDDQLDRLKSAVSNATFIIDTKYGKEVGITTPVKSKDNTKCSKIIVKPTIDSTTAKTVAVKNGGEKKEPAPRPKLLDRRPTAEKPMLLSSVNDNPWGDSLGGLNPLLQPIVTRRRKSRPSLPSTPAADETEPKLPRDITPVSTTPKSLTGSVGSKSGEMSPLINGNHSSNDGHKPNASTAANGTGFAITPPAKMELSTPKTTPTRAPSLDRFNARSPLYGSISAKMKKPTESQSKLLEQLSLLRQQLKKKQKEVEDGLSTSSQSSSRRD